LRYKDIPSEDDSRAPLQQPDNAIRLRLLPGKFIVWRWTRCRRIDNELTDVARSRRGLSTHTSAKKWCDFADRKLRSKSDVYA